MGCAAFGSLPLFLVGTMSVRLQDDLEFGDAVFGFVLASRLVVSGALTIPASRKVQQVGPSNAIRIGAAIGGLSMLGIAAFARSWWSLMPFVAVSGVGSAILFPAGDLWLARRLPPERLGMGFGVKQTGQPVASILAGLAVPLLASTVGWRWAFVAGAGCVSLLVIGLSGARTDSVTPQPVEGRTDAPMRAMVVMAAAMGLATMALSAVAAFFVAAAVESGVGESAGGFMYAAGSVLGIVVRLALGRRADRNPRGLLSTITAMLLLGSTGYVLIATHSPIAFYIAVPLAFGCGWGWTGLFSLVVVRANPQAPAAAVGITATGGQFGAMLGPVTFGLMAVVSHSAAWLLSAVLSLLAAAGMIISRRLLVRHRMSTTPLVVTSPSVEPS